MKNILSFSLPRLSAFIVAGFSCCTGFAQGTPVSISVTGCPAGVYGSFTSAMPAGFSFSVERHEPNGPRRIIEQFAPCVNSAMLLKRLRAFAGVVPGYSLPTKAMADTLWARYGGPGKSLPMEINQPLIRLAFGLSFIDTGGIAGRIYQYRVKFTDTLPATESREIVYRPQPAWFSPITYFQSHTDLHNISIEWRTDMAAAAPLFDVLRRVSGSAAGFQPLAAMKGVRVNETRDSLVFLVFDSTAVAGISYDYCLVSRDYLGNTGNHSDTVRIQAGGRSNVAAIRNLRTRSADSSGIRLSWNPVGKDNALRNIVVLRSAIHDSGYSAIAMIPVTDTTYLDKSAVAGHRYFYQLMTEGSLNFSQATPRVSGIFSGKVQLRAPESFSATGIGGAVTLTWRDNEKNLTGFRVYRSEYAGGTMKFLGESMIGPADSTTFHFTDSVGVSDRSASFYAVAAISHGGVTGPLSPVVSAAPATTNRIPVPVGIRSLMLNDTVVSITWHDLMRETAGIAGYRVYSVKNETDTSTSEWLQQTRGNEFIDTLHGYRDRWYRFSAVNMSGIAGRPGPAIHVRARLDRPVPPGRVRAWRNGSQVVLNWDGAAHMGIRYYNIYRAENTGRLALVDSVSAGNAGFRYTDARVTRGHTYYYFITSVGAGSMESIRSPEVHLVID